MSFKLYLEAFTNRFINPDHLLSTFNNLCFVYKANGKLIKKRNVEHKKLVQEFPEEFPDGGTGMNIGNLVGRIGEHKLGDPNGEKQNVMMISFWNRTPEIFSSDLYRECIKALTPYVIQMNLDNYPVYISNMLGANEVQLDIPNSNNKHVWQSALEKNKLITPGHKWRTPHSESVDRS